MSAIIAFDFQKSHKNVMTLNTSECILFYLVSCQHKKTILGALRKIIYYECSKRKLGCRLTLSGSVHFCHKVFLHFHLGYFRASVIDGKNAPFLGLVTPFYYKLPEMQHRHEIPLLNNNSTTTTTTTSVTTTIHYILCATLSTSVVPCGRARPGVGARDCKRKRACIWNSAGYCMRRIQPPLM